MSIVEWIVELDADLQVTEVRARQDEDTDPANGPLGVMFANKMLGCIYDEWTAKLVDCGWRPQSDEYTWAYARERYPNDTWMFYTNAEDELGAFANLQAWLQARVEVPTCGQNPLTQ
jgi:hypothetical protein